jgi:hypothetical protein
MKKKISKACKKWERRRATCMLTTLKYRLFLLLFFAWTMRNNKWKKERKYFSLFLAYELNSTWHSQHNTIFSKVKTRKVLLTYVIIVFWTIWLGNIHLMVKSESVELRCSTLYLAYFKYVAQKQTTTTKIFYVVNINLMAMMWAKRGRKLWIYTKLGGEKETTKNENFQCCGKWEKKCGTLENR